MLLLLLVIVIVQLQWRERIPSVALASLAALAVLPLLLSFTELAFCLFFVFLLVDIQPYPTPEVVLSFLLPLVFWFAKRMLPVALWLVATAFLLLETAAFYGPLLVPIGWEDSRGILTAPFLNLIVPTLFVNLVVGLFTVFLIRYVYPVRS